MGVDMEEPLPYVSLEEALKPRMRVFRAQYPHLMVRPWSLAPGGEIGTEKSHLVASNLVDFLHLRNGNLILSSLEGAVQNIQK